jgi:hypothetical protein
MATYFTVEQNLVYGAENALESVQAELGAGNYREALADARELVAHLKGLLKAQGKGCLNDDHEQWIGVL